MLHKRFFILLASSLIAPLLVLAETRDPQRDIKEQVPAAKAILQDWWKDADPSKRVLHAAYWTPADREPAPMWESRLQASFEDISAFYGAEMERVGFGNRPLLWERNGENKIIIHLVKGLKPYAEYDVKSGHAIRQECEPTMKAAGVELARTTFVIFCNMSNWDEKAASMSQNSPYYAGGDAKGGTAWQVDSPLLEPKWLTEVDKKLHDGQYGHISYGRYNSIFIGGATHELGHALGLPHNKERADEAALFGTALMGSGNRTYKENLRNEGKGSFITLAHALRLISHPIFSGTEKGLFMNPELAFSELKITLSDKGFRVHGKISGKPPIYALVAYMDPEGGSDYDQTSSSAVPKADGTFSIECDALVPGKSELKIIACHVNGATSTIKAPYTVGADGKAVITEVEQKFAKIVK